MQLQCDLFISLFAKCSHNCFLLTKLTRLISTDKVDSCYVYNHSQCQLSASTGTVQLFWEMILWQGRGILQVTHIRLKKGHLSVLQSPDTNTPARLQHPPVCLCHHIHTLSTVPGTVRVPGKDAVIARSVSAAIRQRQLNHAWWRANIHTHLGRRDDFNTAG